METLLFVLGSHFLIKFDLKSVDNEHRFKVFVRQKKNIQNTGLNTEKYEPQSEYKILQTAKQPIR